MPKGQYARKPRPRRSPKGGYVHHRKAGMMIDPPDEIEPLKSPHSLTIKQDQESGKFLPGTSNGAARRNKHTATVSALVREIGNEVIEGSPGWTRLEGLIRSTFADAIAGNNGAREILLERGWGKVPTPVEIDVKTSFLTISRDMGLTQEDIESDPILAELSRSSNVTLENLPVTLPALEPHAEPK